MDAEKTIEVEMNELIPAEVQNDKDQEKKNREGIKETKKEKEVEEKEDEAATNVSCKLKIPEEINRLAAVLDSPPKHREDAYGKVRVYKRISALFMVLTLLLLAVVLALAMKLYDIQSVQDCPEVPEVEEIEEFNCSRQLCQALYPLTESVENHEYHCTECGKGWVKLENSCYFLAKERLSWQESRKACQKHGGDLVVIGNEQVQKLLTEKRGLLYWIGLRYSEKQQWMWVNNTALTKSYWAYGQPNPDTQDSCVFLRGQKPYANNWYTNPCAVSSHYICQRG